MGQTMTHFVDFENAPAARVESHGCPIGQSVTLSLSGADALVTLPNYGCLCTWVIMVTKVATSNLIMLAPGLLPMLLLFTGT